MSIPGDSGPTGPAKTHILFDHDGVLVDTEQWYFKAGQRALAEVGVVVDQVQYLHDVSHGLGTWEQARLAGVDEQTIARLRTLRDVYYQESLRNEQIEIDGVIEALDELSSHVRMAIVTTSKRADFELIHRDRRITAYMDFVLMREDFTRPKPHPEPYLAGLNRFGVDREAVLVVEDSARGLASAVAAGLDCVVVPCEFTKAQDFTTARYRIAQLSQLVDIVLGR